MNRQTFNWHISAVSVEILPFLLNRLLCRNRNGSHTNTNDQSTHGLGKSRDVLCSLTLIFFSFTPARMGTANSSKRAVCELQCYIWLCKFCYWLKRLLDFDSRLSSFSVLFRLWLVWTQSKGIAARAYCTSIHVYCSLTYVLFVLLTHERSLSFYCYLRAK